MCKDVQHHTWRVAYFLFADDTNILTSLKAKREKISYSILNSGGASKIQCILIEETVIELSCIGLDPSLYNPLILVIC